METTPAQPVMPLFAPMYTVGSETADLRWLTVCYRTDPGLIASILPGPMTAPEDAQVLVWVAEFITARFEGADGSRTLPTYFQGGLAVQARMDSVDCAYPLASYITGLNHGFTGRELFGLPKKQARSVSLEASASSLSANIVSDSGVELIMIKGKPEGAAPDGEIVPDWFTRQRTVKQIPSATGTGYDVSQIVAAPFDFTPSADEPIQQPDVSLTLGRSLDDPIAVLPVRELTYQRYGRTQLQVGYGTYLGAPTSMPSGRGLMAG